MSNEFADYEINDFQVDIIDASNEQPVLVDFWAGWCQPCRVLGPILEKMATEDDVCWSLVKVDVEANPEITQSFQVESIPQVYLVSEGQLVDSLHGAHSEEEVRAWLEPLLEPLVKPLLPVPTDNNLVQAQTFLDAGDEKSAAATLTALLKEDSSNEEARVLLARINLFSNPTEASKLLVMIDETSKLHDSASKLQILSQALLEKEENLPEPKRVADYYAVALIALRAKKMEEAIESFLDVLYRDKSYNGDGARLNIIGIFEFLGRDHALTKAYQRRFEMAVF